MHIPHLLRLLGLVLLVSGAGYLTACGQKGDLYVPEKSSLASTDGSQSR